MPDERLGILVMEVDKFFDNRHQVWDAFKHAPVNAFCVSSPNQRSIKSGQEELVGLK